MLSALVLVCAFNQLSSDNGSRPTTPLKISIELAKKKATVACAGKDEDCLLQDKITFKATGNADQILLAGHNGDDTRVDIQIRLAEGAAGKRIANAVMTTSESDLIDEVSNIAVCTPAP
jgi:hypothetical protein